MVGRPQRNGSPASKIAESGCASRSLRREGRRGLFPDGVIDEGRRRTHPSNGQENVNIRTIDGQEALTRERGCTIIVANSVVDQRGGRDGLGLREVLPR